MKRKDFDDYMDKWREQGLSYDDLFEFINSSQRQVDAMVIPAERSDGKIEEITIEGVKYKWDMAHQWGCADCAFLGLPNCPRDDIDNLICDINADTDEYVKSWHRVEPRLTKEINYGNIKN
jgi:hypothetical protein